nr:Transcription termination factor like [Ipomoea batatas]
MFALISRIVDLHTRASSSIRISSHFVQYTPFSSLSRTLKSKPNDAGDKDSFVVSYLIDKLGFSPEEAVSASKYLNFKTPDKPDSVVSFLKDHGFTDRQILNVVKKVPSLIVSDPKRTLLPKIEFSRTLGFSQDTVTTILSASPTLFKSSVDNCLVPALNLLRTMIPEEQALMTSLKSCIRLLTHDLKVNWEPNIQLLRETGVPESNIVYLLKYQPRAFLYDRDKFRKLVEKVKELEVDRKHVSFVIVLKAMRMGRLTWEKKMEIFKNAGMSEDEVLESFRKYPWLMMISQEKLLRLLDFLINKMGLESSILLRRPQLSSFSLEKRIIPRCVVYQALVERGLVKEDDSLLLHILNATEHKFLQKFVKCHGELAPTLLKIYQNSQEVGFSQLSRELV